MQDAEIPEFQAQLRTMFAGLAISTHDSAERLAERVEGWTVGLRKMPLSTFVRCMEHLLALPAWPDYLPKRRQDMLPADMWKVVRELRAGGHSHMSDPQGRNVVRDYWRSVIIGETCRAFGHTAESFEPVLIANSDALGHPMRSLLDELEQQERRDGRTEGQHRYVQRACGDIARAFPQLATPRAPKLPQPTRAEADLFA